MIIHSVNKSPGFASSYRHTFPLSQWFMMPSSASRLLGQPGNFIRFLWRQKRPLPPPCVSAQIHWLFICHAHYSPLSRNSQLYFLRRAQQRGKLAGSARGQWRTGRACHPGLLGTARYRFRAVKSLPNHCRGLSTSRAVQARDHNPGRANSYHVPSPP